MINNKPLKEISIDGCELLGKGGNGAVYKLDDERIVKIYFSNRADFEKINEDVIRITDRTGDETNWMWISFGLRCVD